MPALGKEMDLCRDARITEVSRIEGAVADFVVGASHARKRNVGGVCFVTCMPGSINETERDRVYRAAAGRSDPK
jgi:hypothetical protein